MNKCDKADIGNECMCENCLDEIATSIAAMERCECWK
jgi:hypothetical protein